MKFIQRIVANINKVFRAYPKKSIFIAVALLLLSILIIERLVSRGTILGYQVINKSNNNTNNSSSFNNTESTGSFACDHADIKKVSKILGSDVIKIGGSLKDTNDPTFTSVCNYSTTQKPSRSATIVIKELNDETEAKDFLKSVGKREHTKKIDVGNGAYYSNKTRQLISLNNKKIITVTVSEPQEHSKVDNKNATIEITKLLL